jgi:SAM-dependent methyltransferase
LSNIRCQQGSATATGLEPASFDVVIMRHVLAHNGGREQAIVEHLATLLKPGGCVYLVDIEMTAVRTYPAAPDLDDLGKRYQAFHAARGNDVSVGLRLGELVRGAGLEVLEHRGWYEVAQPPPGFRPPSWAARDAMVAEGFATQEDLDRWIAALEWHDANPGRLTLFIPLFSATGRRVS